MSVQVVSMGFAVKMKLLLGKKASLHIVYYVIMIYVCVLTLDVWLRVKHL